LESKAGFRLISRWNQTSISGSFLDWKMLAGTCGTLFVARQDVRFY
jgi:hypothetical protein